MGFSHLPPETLTYFELLVGLGTVRAGRWKFQVPSTPVPISGEDFKYIIDVELFGP